MCRDHVAALGGRIGARSRFPDPFEQRGEVHFAEPQAIAFESGLSSSS